MRWYYVFLLAFVGSLIIQTWIWSEDRLTDESVWAERLQHFEADLKAGQFQQRHYSAHPGLAPLWMALLLKHLGLPPATSLEASVAIWVSVLAGVFAAVTFALLPHSPASVAVAGLVALHPLYVQSSLANAVAGPATALGLLAVLFLHTQARSWVAWLIGIAFGISLITHFSVSALVVAPALLFVLAKYGWKLAGLASVITFATFAIFNPLFLQHPLQHFRFNFHYIALHTNVLGVARLGAEDIVLVSPFAVLGIFAGVATLLSRRLPRLFDHPSLIFVIGLTVAVTGVLLYAQTQSIRYFFSLVVFWEVMFTIWILELARRSPWATVLSGSVVSLLIGGQALLMAQAL